MSTQTPKSTPQVTTLPPELRLELYTRLTILDSATTLSKDLLALIHTSRPVRTEVLPIAQTTVHTAYRNAIRAPERGQFVYEMLSMSCPHHTNQQGKLEAQKQMERRVVVVSRLKELRRLLEGSV